MQEEYPPCSDVYLWYKRVCNDIEKKATLKDYKCPDFNMEEQERMVEDFVKSLEYSELQELLQFHGIIHLPNHLQEKMLGYKLLLEQLSEYLVPLSVYLGRIRECAQNRENHYSKCYKSRDELEDDGHKHWRETYTKIVQDCEETLKYWQKQEQQIRNKVDNLNFGKVEKNQRRRQKEKERKKRERVIIDEAYLDLVDPDIDLPDEPKPDPKNIVYVPTREANQKRGEERRQRHMEERAANKEMLDRIEQAQKQSLTEYLGMTGLITDLEGARNYLKRSDFNLFFDTLDSRLAIFCSSNSNAAPISREQCVSEWRQGRSSLFLLLPLTLGQQKRMVQSLMMFTSNRDEARRTVWIPFIDKLYQHAPEIAVGTSYKDLSNGTLDNPAEEPIYKSTFMSLLYVLSDAYIDKASKVRNVKWDPEVMFEIIGLLSAATAPNVLHKLELRKLSTPKEDHVYINGFIDAIKSYIAAHVNFYARMLENSFALPEGCFGAALACDKYRRYMQAQVTTKPLHYSSAQGLKLQLKITKFLPGSQEQKRINAIFKKIAQACRIQIK